MPRKRKPVQPVAAAPQQVYGQGVEQTEAMKAIPLPDVEQARVNATQGGLSATPGTPLPAGAVPAAPPQGAAGGFAGALDAARMMTPPQGALREVMAGARPGPGVMDRSDVWVQMAEMTGDPSFLRIAQRARLTR